MQMMQDAIDQGLIRDYEPRGVTVTVFRPGAGVLTDAFRVLNEDPELLARVPTPESVAPAVVWLCSREARTRSDRLVSGLDFDRTWGPAVRSGSKVAV